MEVKRSKYGFEALLSNETLLTNEQLAKALMELNHIKSIRLSNVYKRIEELEGLIERIEKEIEFPKSEDTTIYTLDTIHSLNEALDNLFVEVAKLNGEQW